MNRNDNAIHERAKDDSPVPLVATADRNAKATVTTTCAKKDTNDSSSSGKSSSYHNKLVDYSVRRAAPSTRKARKTSTTSTSSASNRLSRCPCPKQKSIPPATTSFTTTTTTGTEEDEAQLSERRRAAVLAAMAERSAPEAEDVLQDQSEATAAAMMESTATFAAFAARKVPPQLVRRRSIARDLTTPMGNHSSSNNSHASGSGRQQRRRGSGSTLRDDSGNSRRTCSGSNLKQKQTRRGSHGSSQKLTRRGSHGSATTGTSAVAKRLTFDPTTARIMKKSVSTRSLTRQRMAAKRHSEEEAEPCIDWSRRPSSSHDREEQDKEDGSSVMSLGMEDGSKTNNNNNSRCQPKGRPCLHESAPALGYHGDLMAGLKDLEEHFNSIRGLTFDDDDAWKTTSDHDHKPIPAIRRPSAATTMSPASESDDSEDDDEEEGTDEAKQIRYAPTTTTNNNNNNTSSSSTATASHVSSTAGTNNSSSNNSSLHHCGRSHGTSTTGASMGTNHTTVTALDLRQKKMNWLANHVAKRDLLRKTTKTTRTTAASTPIRAVKVIYPYPTTRDSKDMDNTAIHALLHHTIPRYDDDDDNDMEEDGDNDSTMAVVAIEEQEELAGDVPVPMIVCEFAPHDSHYSSKQKQAERRGRHAIHHQRQHSNKSHSPSPPTTRGC